MRVLIISDVHGNSAALRKIINVEKYDAVWFLGDFTDYGPDPDECLDILRELQPEVWVSGNHDYANAFGVDCKCGEKTHELSVYTRDVISQKLISKEDLRWMRGLPLTREMKIHGKDFIFVHACPKDPLYGYMYDFKPECMTDELGVEIHKDVLVYGHTHFPIMGKKGGVQYINPGSVGQPKVGDSRAEYGIYDGVFHLKRIKYDVEETVKKLDALGLEKKYRDLLVSILRSGKV